MDSIKQKLMPPGPVVVGSTSPRHLTVGAVVTVLLVGLSFVASALYFTVWDIQSVTFFATTYQAGCEGLSRPVIIRKFQFPYAFQTGFTGTMDCVWKYDALMNANCYNSEILNAPFSLTPTGVNAICNVTTLSYHLELVGRVTNPPTGANRLSDTTELTCRAVQYPGASQPCAIDRENDNNQNFNGGGNFPPGGNFNGTGNFTGNGNFTGGGNNGGPTNTCTGNCGGGGGDNRTDDSIHTVSVHPFAIVGSYACQTTLRVNRTINQDAGTYGDCRDLFIDRDVNGNLVVIPGLLIDCDDEVAAATPRFLCTQNIRASVFSIISQASAIASLAFSVATTIISAVLQMSCSTPGGGARSGGGSDDVQPFKVKDDIEMANAPRSGAGYVAKE